MIVFWTKIYLQNMKRGTLICSYKKRGITRIWKNGRKLLRPWYGNKNKDEENSSLPFNELDAVISWRFFEGSWIFLDWNGWWWCTLDRKDSSKSRCPGRVPERTERTDTRRYASFSNACVGVRQKTLGLLAFIKEESKKEMLLLQEGIP